MNKLRSIILGNAYLIIFLAFLVRSAIFIDPDFGWHITLGKIIVNNGVPTVDPLSYTMPSYPFVDHEWLTNVFVYTLSALHMHVATVFFAAVAALSLYLVLHKSMHSKEKFITSNLKFAFAFLVAGVFMDFVGIRPQVLSWLYLSIATVVLYYPALWKKYKYYLPLLILLWSNTHGTFGVGVLLVASVYFLGALVARRVNVIDTLVVAIVIVVSFVNPYGYRLWWELWMQGTDSSLRWTIAEWAPAIFSFNAALLAYLSFSIMLVGKYIRSLPKVWVLVYCFFLLQAILSVRNEPLWLIVSLPLTIDAGKQLITSLENTPEALRRLKRASVYWLMFCAVVFLLQSTSSVVATEAYSEKNYYPRQAIEFLNENPPEGEIFNYYAWGGYLEWKYPGHKVFIDGRMPSWRRLPVEGESSNVMKDYREIVTGKKDIVEYIEKYGITDLLYPKRTTSNNLGKAVERLLGTSHTDNLITKLDKSVWTRVYEDELAVIYRYNRVNE